MKNFFYKNLPLPLQKIIATVSGRFLMKEKFCLISPPWFAYGLLLATKQAKKYKLRGFTAIEFGVANGRGFKLLNEIKTKIEEIENIDIRLVGFDTGIGMPYSEDYRDHPDQYHESDFSMEEDFKTKFKKNLILGDLRKTIPSFYSKLDENYPIGFFSMDVDVYSATKCALKLFEKKPQYYLPYVSSYFDDCSGRTHFSKFTGELLAIEEFNKENAKRKLDYDRGVWNEHKSLPYQIWYQRMFILHIFDHPFRKIQKNRKKKII